MAASLKMDELLVSWLGSDDVYDNVLSLVEKYRDQKGKEALTSISKGGRGDGVPEGNPAEDEGEASVSVSGGGDGDSSNSHRCVIPPFYRPAEPGGSKRKLKRFKSTGFEEDQTWDGTGIKTEGGGGGGVAAGAIMGGDLGSATASGDGSSAASLAAVPSDASKEERGKAGAGSASAATAASKSIKEQVQAIFTELGGDPAPPPLTPRGEPSASIMRRGGRTVGI